MRRMLPALVFAVFIHAIVLRAAPNWMMGQKTIAPQAQVITMRLIERAPYCPPAIRPLVKPPPTLPPNPQKTAVKKPTPKKPVVKAKPVVPKPKPVTRSLSKKPPAVEPQAPSLPELAANTPAPESLTSPASANLARSTVDKPTSTLDSVSPPAVTAATAAPDKKLAEIATVVMATPRYNENSPPIYPTIARKRGYEGTVILEVFVKAAGQVGDLRIAESSNYKLLDRSAVKAVKRWRFEPGRQAGKTVAMWVRVPVDFRLQ